MVRQCILQFLLQTSDPSKCLYVPVDVCEIKRRALVKIQAAYSKRDIHDLQVIDGRRRSLFSLIFFIKIRCQSLSCTRKKPGATDKMFEANEDVGCAAV